MEDEEKLDRQQLELARVGAMRCVAKLEIKGVVFGSSPL